MYFGYFSTPINVFGNNFPSHDSGTKIGTSIFVQNLFWRTIYIESNIEEDTDVKCQVNFTNLPYPQKHSDAVC